MKTRWLRPVLRKGRLKESLLVLTPISPWASGLRFARNDRGVTLIELLITIIISAIAILAAAVPFVAERSFWVSGQSQTEAQRDAQMAIRSIARVARESAGYSIVSSSGRSKITFNVSCGTMNFEGGPSFNSGRLDMNDCAGNNVKMINGTRSQVTHLVFTRVNSKLVRIQLEVTHETRENENLQTELFLRNA